MAEEKSWLKDAEGANFVVGQEVAGSNKAIEPNGIVDHGCYGVDGA